MLKIFKNKIKKNIEIFALISLILITAISTSYFNFSKKKSEQTYNSFIDKILAFLNCKFLRREVWTARLIKKLSYTL